MVRLPLAALLPTLLSACADAGAGDATAGFTGVISTASSGDESSGAASSETGISSKLDLGLGDVGTLEIAEVFGHSADTLYRLDPDTNAVTEVGPFEDCQATIIDIALDADSQMYGTAFTQLYRIDRSTGKCVFIAEGEYPTSLSFVPAGTVLPDREALVGFVDEQYIRIDQATGQITPIGTLPGGLASSGDLVSVADGGTYLTVVGPGCESGDCIVEIDPATGSIVQNYGPLPYSQVFGLAFWAGRAYGFSAAGDLFEISFGDTNVATTDIAIPGAPNDLSFFGAGSTTSAPPLEG